jgi:putative colanic acid biosynthesis UDP-glucose lipid carrier transferase
LARDGVIGLVVIAADDGDLPQTLLRIVECLKAAPVRVALCNTPTPAEVGSVGYFSVAGIPMSLIADRPLTRRDMLIKMIVDKLGSLLLLVLALPLLLAIAFAILLESGGPIIFQQRRNGWCGRLFTVFKFRTMRHAPGQHALYQTQRADPRCTRVGSLLRRTSLDELPQLWNVLRGDMSLVGPRPHADFMHAMERIDCGPLADYVQRQRVKPGLTGWAQVNGNRGAIDTPEKLCQRVAFDRYYIENWSIWLDLKILAKTPWAVLSRENAF